MTSVLVTGGLGGLGGAIVQHLAKYTESTVVVLDNLSSPSLDVRYLGSRVNFYRGDVCNEELVSHLLERHSVDTIIDCSSRATPKTVLDAANVLKNFTHLLEAVRPHKDLKHFVLASRPQKPFEEQPLCPGDLGLASLMSAEAMLHSYVISYRLPLVTARVGYLAEGSSELKGTVNLISSSEAAKGVLASAAGSSASVYNIVGPRDFDLETKTNLATKFNTAKATQELDFTASSVVLSENQEKKEIQGLEKVLIYGSGPVYDKLKVQLGKNGVEFEEGKTWPGWNSDKEVSDELIYSAPSHVICVCTSDIEEGEGTPCERLKLNTYGLLFPPWQLASFCEKRGIHYTFIGSDQLFSPAEIEKKPIAEDVNGNNQETNQGSVKSYTERLLNHFPHVLQFRLGQASATDETLNKVVHLFLSRASGLWNAVAPGVSSHLDGIKFQKYTLA